MELTSTVDAEGTAMSAPAETPGMSDTAGTSDAAGMSDAAGTSEQQESTGIVVGLDISVPAQAALAWAANQARLTGQDLTAVHAVFPWGTYLAAGGFVPVTMPSDAVQDHQRDMIEKLFDSVGPEPTWKLQFVGDDPGPALVAASRGASMLVIGTREHTGWGRVLSGSVSHHCLSHAHCPVLAVPVERPARAGRSAAAASATSHA